MSRDFTGGIKDSYKKRYKMRALGEDGLNIVVSIPKIVIEREVGRRELTVGKFLEKFRAVAQFNSFDGVFYTFEEIVLKEIKTEPGTLSQEMTK